MDQYGFLIESTKSHPDLGLHYILALQPKPGKRIAGINDEAGIVCDQFIINGIMICGQQHDVVGNVVGDRCQGRQIWCSPEPEWPFS